MIAEPSVFLHIRPDLGCDTILICHEQSVRSKSQHLSKSTLTGNARSVYAIIFFESIHLTSHDGKANAAIGLQCPSVYCILERTDVDFIFLSGNMICIWSVIWLMMRTVCSDSFFPHHYIFSQSEIHKGKDMAATTHLTWLYLLLHGTFSSLSCKRYEVKSQQCSELVILIVFFYPHAFW